MSEVKNSTKQLMTYFSTDERPVTVAEFGEFWRSMSDEAKVYYRTVNLETGLVDTV